MVLTEREKLRKLEQYKLRPNQIKIDMKAPEIKEPRLFVYDFETSGFWNDRQSKLMKVPLNQPIQVAIIVKELDGTHNYYNSYIKYPGRLTKGVIDATKITDDVLAREGKPIEEVFAKINEMLNVPDTLIVGHNTLEFDNKFMDHYLRKFGHEPLVNAWCYDTLGQFKGHLLQRPKGQYESFETYHWDLVYAGGSTVKSTLEDLCKYYGITTQADFHNAVPDTRYTYEVFKEQFKDWMNLAPIRKNGILGDKNQAFLAKQETASTYKQRNIYGKRR